MFDCSEQNPWVLSIPLDKQNDDQKENTAGSQNIASVRLSLSLYLVSAVLLQTAQTHIFCIEAINGGYLRILWQRILQLRQWLSDDFCQ